MKKRKKRKRKSSMGKRKGGAFERTICRKLSLWISEGKHNDLFWRSAGSGSSATVAIKKNQKRRTGLGDITSIDPKSAWLTRRFFIEVKFYRDLHFDSDVLCKTKRGIGSFWRVAKAASKLAGRFPMLICKQNRGPILVCMPRWIAFSMGGNKALLCTVPSWDMAVLSLDKFFTTVSPMELKRAANIRSSLDRKKG